MNELLSEYSQNPQAQKVIRVLFSTNDSVFLTGCAGTGKTRLLSRIMETISKSFVFLAPNPGSAISSGAQTLHSFFRLPQRSFMPDDEDIPQDEGLIRILEKVELIIIDDIPMVRADLMNAIDLSLRKHLDSQLPFAGKQFLLVGDLYQASPSEETTGLFPTKYFFGAPAFSDSFALRVIELSHSYRYADKEFFELLQKIREGRVDDDALRMLNTRYIPALVANDEAAGLLVAISNLTADRINQEKFDELPGEAFAFQAIETGIFTDYSQDPGCPADRILTLKPETRVLFIKDDPQGRWAKGTTGRILGISEESLEVITDPDEVHVNVDRMTWSAYEYGWDTASSSVVKMEAGKLTQFPVKAIWAQTLKNAYGQDYDSMMLDLGSGAFVHGQTYLGLSRSRSFESLMLRTLVRPDDIIADPEVTDFMTREMSSGKNDAIWTVLMDLAGAEYQRDLADQSEKLKNLQESSSGLTQALERARGENSRNTEKIKTIEKTNQTSQSRINELLIAKETRDHEATILQKRIDKKDRWINFLLIIQLIFFLAALGILFYKVV